MEPSEIGESNRGRKADADRQGRTAWGLGGGAPASLDVYGQSRMTEASKLFARMPCVSTIEYEFRSPLLVACQKDR
jgi:hypothetical protein